MLSKAGKVVDIDSAVGDLHLLPLQLGPFRSVESATLRFART